MRAKRPTSVLVIAIFHFIFGGLGLLCGLPGLVMQAAGMNRIATTPAGASQQQKEMQETQERIQKRTEQEAPLMALFLLGNAIINLFISLLLILAGVGLLRLQLWGWYTSVVYGVLRIVMQIYTLLFSLLYSLPLTGRILEEEMRKQPALQPLAWIYQIITPVAIITAVLGLIYPIIVLFFMSRPKVRAAFRGEAMDADDAEDFADDFTDRRDRREDEYGEESENDDDDPDDRFRRGR